MSEKTLEKLRGLSNRELRLLINQTIEQVEELAGMKRYLTVSKVKRRGKTGYLYRIYNFIDREELSFYSEKAANVQFIRLLDEAGYLQGA